MRVAINLLGLPSIRQGGAGFAAATLIRGLARRFGVEVRVLCSEAVAGELSELRGSVDLRPLALAPGSPASNALGLARSRTDARRYGGAGLPAELVAGCDVVHYPLSFMAPPRHTLPTVVTALDLQHLELPRHFSRRDRLLRAVRWHGSLRQATRVVAISQYTKRSLVSRLGIDPDGIDVVRLACHERFLAAGPVGATDLARYVFYPASPLPAKNHDRLIAAFARVAAQDTEVSLVLSGPRLHDWQPVTDSVRRHGVEGRVRLAGHLSLDELRTHYARAQGLVFPSLYEGLGLPVVEAMACGCPVVASDTAGLPEILDGAAALLFDPRSDAEIEAAILRCLSMPAAERARLAAAGRLRAGAFTVDAMVDGVLAAYERAVARAG